MGIKQETRMLAIKTALGPDVLAVRSIAVQERISRLFHIEAGLSSTDGEIDFDKVIGHDATLRLDVGQKAKRYFHGYVSRLVQVANEGGFAHYRATIVPYLWFLTRTSDCRIFQNKTVPDIVEQIFKDRGLDDYKVKLTANYEPREFCVQYRETDFNFVSRLMEQEGIYYYFEHQDGKHTLVLADSISAHNPFEGYAEVPFMEPEKGASGREGITDWVVEKEVQPVASALEDFDFKKPGTDLKASTNVTRQYGKAEFEVYDYPGEYVEHSDGDRLAAVRLDELQSHYEVLSGQATARGLAPGCIFKLKNHPRADQNREYLVTSISLDANAGEFASTGVGSSEGQFFTCGFTAIVKDQQYRPARLTPKPIVQGPQTAIVTGPGSDEIYTDEYARVKVHFHWDRHDDQDENSSCWIRVSQHWAGKEWGSIHIPRIGQEVVVEFLEGDPDRPIITGRVYNAEQVPPYDLPANKTQSGIKSRSSTKGTTENFNEIRFEDKKGSEQLYIHAEKDKQVVVENDRTENVGHDESITIGNNRSESVGKDESISIGNNRTEDVTKNEKVDIGENRSTTVGKNEDLSVGEKRSITVGKDETLEVGENRTKTVSKNETVSVGENLKETIGKNQAVEVSKAFVLDAGDQIVLTTGSASISLKNDGTIAIKGNNVSIEGSGKVKVQASSDVIVKGSKVTAN